MTPDQEEISQNNTDTTEEKNKSTGHESTRYQSSTKRIAKNTLMLYFRQILIMLVSLYTVRVVLNTLGAEDYGIYNVVAGVVVLFSFVNNAMATATQRFLNYSLGENDLKKMQEIYSFSLIIHLGIAVVFVLLAETVGLWFVSNKLNIPEVRKTATAIVYQFTIITTVFNILRVPYNALIIAYEKISFFAWLSILEAILKLAIVFLLILSDRDRLVLYAFLMTAVALIILCFYKLYCNRTFEIARYRKVTDISLVKKIVSFSGWSLFGAVANIANSQGTNIVLNMFTNVTVNAAMGIANQVNSTVYSFVGNFQTAFNPQIVKNYAEGKKIYFTNLIYRSSKISFLLSSFIIIPLLLNMDLVLNIWLKEVPVFTTQFLKLCLVCSLIESWNNSLTISIQAVGDIKKYQIIVSLFIFLNLPLSLIALTIGSSPIWILLIRLILLILAVIWRIFFLEKVIKISSKYFFIQVIGRCVFIFTSVYLCAFLVGCFIQDCVIYFFATCFFSFFFMCFFIFYIGLTSTERRILLRFFRKGKK